MFDLRRRAAAAIDRTGIGDLVLRARARVWSPYLTVLTYHRVRDVAPDEPFDTGVVDATPAQLDRQLAFLRERFRFVELDEVRAHVVRRKPLPPNPVLVTFDDGYRDCLDVALPILERHGVRAAFFIATSYVTERRLFWWDRVSYLIKRSERDRLELSYPSPRSLDLNDGGRERAIRAVLRIVKDEFALDIKRFLDELAAAAGVAWDRDLERRLADELILDWDGVRALRNRGQDVQSHTRTHRVLQTLPADALRAELAGSRADLERELQEPVRCISYPVGKAIARIPAIRDAITDAGYELGFSNVTGVNFLPGGLDPLDISRISVETELADATFRSMLAVPALAASHS